MLSYWTSIKCTHELEPRKKDKHISNTSMLSTKVEIIGLNFLGCDFWSRSENKTNTQKIN